MPAVRIDTPEGIMGPVWLAHVVRTAIALHAGDPAAHPLSLRLEGADNSASARNAYPTRNRPSVASNRSA